MLVHAFPVSPHSPLNLMSWLHPPGCLGTRDVSSRCTKSLKTPQFSKQRGKCPRSWKPCQRGAPACSWPAGWVQVLQPVGFIDSPEHGRWDFPQTIHSLGRIVFIRPGQAVTCPNSHREMEFIASPPLMHVGEQWPPHLLLLLAGPCFPQSTSRWKCPFLRAAASQRSLCNAVSRAIISWLPIPTRALSLGS